MVIVEQKQTSRQVRKMSRDIIQPTTSVRKRNRRFKKNLIVDKNVKDIDLTKNKASKK